MMVPGKRLARFLAAAVCAAALAACGTPAPTGSITDSVGRVPVRLLATPDLAVTTLTVDATSGTLMVDAQILAVPFAAPGDVLEVDAFVEVSTSGILAPLYTVGIGYHLWAQPTGQPALRVRISPYVGVNVGEPVPHGHYAEPVNAAVWQVPEGWTGGVEVIGVLDAMSTAARTPPDVMGIRTGYSLLKVKVWR